MSHQSKLLRFWFASVCLLAAGCQVVAPPVASPAAGLPSPAAPSVDPTPAGGGSGASTPSTAPTPTALPIERARYHLTAVLDFPTARLAVQEEISYPNTSSDPLGELALVVEPARFAGAFELGAIGWDRPGSSPGYDLRGSLLRIPLDPPLAVGERVRLALNYTLTLPRDPGPFSAGARQINLADWYPYVPPFQSGEGWLIHPAAPVGEHLVFDTADFEVDITLSGAPQDVQVAASAPASVEGNSYHFELPAARSFALALSNQMETLSAQSGAVEVRALIFPEDRAAGEAALETMTRALGVYAHLFAPYPYRSLTMVEAGFFDGMEYDGLFFLGQQYFLNFVGGPQNYLTTLSAHETAHQWWYGLVGSDPAVDPWLDEALCTYSEYLFFEQSDPSRLDWWWNFRITRWQPQGWVNSSLYDHGAFRPYVNAVYLRGASFLHALRQRVGDEVFFSFISDYAQTYRDKLASSADFFALLAKHTDLDLSDLISEYFKPF